MNLKQFKKLNVGIVGCGYWATNIIKSLEEENFNNLYVYDSSKKKLVIIPNTICNSDFLNLHPETIQQGFKDGQFAADEFFKQHLQQ